MKENNALYRELVASKDSTIDNYRLQSHSLELVVNNQSTIIGNKDLIIGDINARLQKSLAKIERQRKAKKWLIGGSAAFGAAAVKWGPQVIKMILKR